MNIETGAANPGVVAVDVSSVCRDERLPGSVDFTRLELVLEAWREQMDGFAKFYLAADRSLLREMKPDVRRVAEDMRDKGELDLFREADDALLDHAEKHGGCVLSRDRFLDKRRDYEWVRERFYTWEIGKSKEGKNRVRITRQPSCNTQSFDISRAVEQKWAKSRGFPNLQHPAAKELWRCVSDDPCLTRQITPNALKVLPILKGDVALCPGCEKPLLSLGERPAEAELKLVFEGTTLAWFTLKAGEEVTFGRSTMPDTAALAELARKGAFDGVGRAHADLRMEGKLVAIRPVDDKHQVEVATWDTQERDFDKPREIPHGDGFTTIGTRDVILIGNRLELVRSGRSITEAEQLTEGGDADWRRRTTAEP